MDMNIKDFRNNVVVKGVVYNYYVNKNEKAERAYDREGVFKKGDTYTQYRGYVDVLTNPETKEYVRIDVQGEPEVYKSGENKGEATSKSVVLEAMAKKTLPSFKRTNSVQDTPTIQVYGRGNFNLKFSDNIYFSDPQTLIEQTKLDLGFANMYVNDPTDAPVFENNFIVHGFVEDFKPEVVKGEETDRLVVKIKVPYTTGSEERGNLQTKVMPLSFVAGVAEDEEGEYDLAELIEEAEDDGGVIGYSWRFTGRVRGYEESSAPKAEDGRRRIGRKIVDAEGKHQQEIVLEGIDSLGDGMAFPEDDIRELDKARQVHIENERKKAEDRASKKDGAKKGRGNFAGGASAGAGASAGGRGARSGASETGSEAPARRNRERKSWQ